MEHCRVFFLVFSSHLASPFFCLIRLNNGYTQNQEELSTRHLSDDFARVSLPQFTQDLQSSHHHNLPLESWHLNFSASSAWRPAIFFSRFPQGISFANLPGSPNDLTLRRWRGLVVWALDLNPGGPGFKSFSLPLAGFVFCSPDLNSTTLCK